MGAAIDFEMEPSSPHKFEIELAKEMTIEKKTMEDIVQTGYCFYTILFLEKVRSQEPGAFAKRRIQKNSTIVHTPMLHILHKDALNLSTPCRSGSRWCIYAFYY